MTSQGEDQREGVRKWNERKERRRWGLGRGRKGKGRRDKKNSNKSLQLSTFYFIFFNKQLFHIVSTIVDSQGLLSQNVDLGFYYLKIMRIN